MDKKRNKLLLYVAVPICLIGGFLYWLTWTGSTAHIESVADQFKAPSSWKLVGSYSKPPSTVCLEGSCPSLSRTWTTPTPLTEEELSAVTKQSGWGDLVTENDCESREDYVCPLRGTVSGYHIYVGVDKNDYLYKEATVSISLE